MNSFSFALVLLSSAIVYTYPGSAQKMRFPDISLPDGQHAMILGRSGSGKTTLLHILAGLLTPTEGDVVMDGQSFKNLSSVQLDHFRGQKIGIVFQQSFFIQAITLSENLAWAQRLAGRAVDYARIDTLLSRLQIANHKDHLPSKMSIGEQQRASIARAIVNKPSVIFADEPTSALDDFNASHVIQLLSEQAEQEKAALVIVTHDARIKSHFNHQIILGS